MIEEKYTTARDETYDAWGVINSKTGQWVMHSVSFEQAQMLSDMMNLQADDGTDYL